MKKQLLIFILFNKTLFATGNTNVISKNELLINNDKYMSPFPYDVEIHSDNLKYKWKKTVIQVTAQNKHKLKNCNQLINNLPNIIYEFQTGFEKHSKDYFEYLINYEINNNINNDNITDISEIDFKKHSKYIVETYNNPVNKNPFIFKINDNIFHWQDSKIFSKEYDHSSINKLNNILINFNDSSKYFYYLVQKVVKIQSLKIDIKYNQNIEKDYKVFTFNTTLDNPFDNVVVIKDCVRTYRWYDDRIEVVSPIWLNDNLSKNNYSIFLQLLNKSTNNFNRSKYNKLEDFCYFLKQELGENILVYALNLEGLGWKTIESLNNNYVSTVFNNKTGYVEVSNNKSNQDNIMYGYDWTNDKDDF